MTTNKLKKIIYILLTIILLFYFFLNFISSYLENKIISIISSKKFENFSKQKLDNFLNYLGEGKLSDEQIIHYQNKVIKIKKKFEPVFEDINEKK